MAKPKQINQIKEINQTQQKILTLCYYKPQPLSYLLEKLNMNRGYLYDLCLRLIGLGLLIKKPGVSRTFYLTNHEFIKIE